MDYNFCLTGRPGARNLYEHTMANGNFKLSETSLLCGLTIDSIVQNFFFFPEALTRKSETIAYMGHLL